MNKAKGHYQEKLSKEHEWTLFHLCKFSVKLELYQDKKDVENTTMLAGCESKDQVLHVLIWFLVLNKKLQAWPELWSLWEGAWNPP